MTVLLSRAGAAVTTASTAVEGVTAFQHERPDIIISDIGLPDADGFSLIRQIRTLESTAGQPPIPAIALTAYTHEKDRLAATQSGFNHHIAKPIDPTQLFHQLHQLRQS
jgi:CheY-like chemotaxis protein